MLSSILRATAYRNPLLRTVVPTVALAFGIQGAVAVPSIAAHSERFYDLSGSVTYLSCTALSLVLPWLRTRSVGGGIRGQSGATLLQFLSNGPGSWRKLALSAAVGIWATRLGTYLFARIRAEGNDSRFDSIRDSPLKFAGAFFAQATWVSLCILPVIALNALPASVFAAGGSILLTDIVGFALWIAGFGLEVAADAQKSAWAREKAEKKHEEDFLAKGLWSIVRFPNYTGEITSWVGIATVAGGVLTSLTGVSGSGLPAGILGKVLASTAVSISPLFVTLLLTKVSGIPLSEGKYDRKFGDREDYKQWRYNTARLIPKVW